MDHGLQKGDELRDRSTAELNEAAVVRVRLWEPEGTGGGPGGRLPGWAPGALSRHLDPRPDNYRKGRNRTAKSSIRDGHEPSASRGKKAAPTESLQAGGRGRLTSVPD